MLYSLRSLKRFEQTHVIMGCFVENSPIVKERWRAMNLDETLKFEGPIRVTKSSDEDNVKVALCSEFCDKYPVPEGFFRVESISGVTIYRYPFLSYPLRMYHREKAILKCKELAKQGTPVIVAHGKQCFQYDFEKAGKIADGDFVIEYDGEFMVMRYDPAGAKTLSPQKKVPPFINSVHKHGFMYVHELRKMLMIMQGCIHSQDDMRKLVYYMKWSYDTSPRREFYAAQILAAKRIILKLHGQAAWRKGWRRTANIYSEFMSESIEALPVMKQNKWPWNSLAKFVVEEKQWLETRRNKGKKTPQARVKTP